jgi:C2 domain
MYIKYKTILNGNSSNQRKIILMLLESKVSGGFSLTVFQARLDISVSAIGSMNPQIQISYSGVSIKTRAATGMDRLPMWSETFNFEYIDTELEIIAFHKPLLLKDIEIGRCKISVEENSGWFELRKDSRKVGSVRVGIREDRETFMNTAHTTKDSWDLRDDYVKKLNELELEKEEAVFYKKKYKLKLERLRQKKRKSSSIKSLNQDDDFEVPSDNLTQNLSLKIQTQIKKLQVAQVDLNKRKELLKVQEDNIINEKNKISEEWEEISKARQELNVLKQKIDEEFTRLKNEQQKICIQSKLVDINRQSTGKPSREHQRYQQIMNRIQFIGSPEAGYRQENLTDRRSQSIEDIHEKAQVNRIPFTVEKPRPPLHPLSANSSRLISFE